MWYQRAQKALRLRTIVVLVFIVVVVGFGAFGDKLMRPFAPLCKEAPAYREDVPAELKAKIEALLARQQLYCVTPPEGLANLDGPVYWGTDGVDSLLFFQLTDPAGTSVDRYAFSQEYLPGPRGGPPPDGFRNTAVGRMAYANQAPPGSRYFHLELGAPGDYDAAVAVDISGPAVVNPGLTGRNFWLDLDRLVRLIQRLPPEAQRQTTQRVSIPVLPDSWVTARRQVVTPDFAGEKGRTNFLKVRDTAVPGPTLVQALNGPLGAGLWVTGVVSGTTPALQLLPREGGAPLTPRGETQVWVSSVGNGRMASFGFPPLPEGATYDARYWHDARRAASAPPDASFPVVAP